MDKGYVTGTVFLDLREAFDTVDHLLTRSSREKPGGKAWNGSARISLVEFNKRCVLMHCLPQQKSPWDPGGGVLPYKRLLEMCCWMGSHFHDWIDYNGVAFLVELLEWGRTFSGFLG